eukprot:gene12809-17171_t
MDSYNHIESEFVINRENILAFEYWNVKKNLINQSDSLIKTQNEVKSKKKLINNLQESVGILELKNSSKSNEIIAQKKKIKDLENNVHFLSRELNESKGVNLRIKKILHEQQHQNSLLIDQINNSNIEKEVEKIQSQLKYEFSIKEAEYQSEIDDFKHWVDRLRKEKQNQSSMLEEKTARVVQLELTNKHLENILSTKDEEYLSYTNMMRSEFEKAYDNLHQKYELLIDEMEKLKSSSATNEKQNRLMKNYILSEGLPNPPIFE